MPNESSNYIPVIVPLTTLAVADNISIVGIPANSTIMSINGSLRTLVSGTQTVLVKNDTGTTLGTITWVASGTTSGTVNSSAVLANDSLHFNITSLGVSAVDCTVNVWLKVGSIG